MKSTLVLGLGNRLMGDDGIACRVADRLASDRTVLANADVMTGVMDLLRLTDHFRGRRRVFVIDAAFDDAPPGTVSVLDVSDLNEMTCGRKHAHGTSPADTLGLLRVVDGLEARTALSVLTISIGSARVDEDLSPVLARALPTITNRVRDLIAGDGWS